ncbi:hypothetical protein CH373_15780 [Leptospira perolatii]|uniref:Beta-propeller repeat protein n=2 Tax=Leptospira perolatii TaxID=2023191 RepID=A0A2M9ZJH3_9LEPT|nr:hypothetical protein CH360_14240 [Leptospira perolatii]PJZ72217.1 hypothetical protein CH373_15780 [Leptospira perolatii]
MDASCSASNLLLTLQPPGNLGNKQWDKLFGVSGGITAAVGIKADLSGNTYTTGFTNGNLDGITLSGSQDLLITKYDSIGNKVWTRLLGASGVQTSPNSITQDSQGNLYSAGSVTGNLDGQTLTGNQDLFVTKYDTSGNKQWTRLLGYAGSITVSYGITSDSMGNIYATGSTNGDIDGQIHTGALDLFLIKYDNLGNRKWTRLLGVAGANTTVAAAATDTQGNIYVTGLTTGNLDGQTLKGSSDLFVVKYDSSGVKQWTRLLGAGTASGRGIASDPSGFVYVSGNTSTSVDGETVTGYQDLVIVKYDSLGNKHWTRLLGAVSTNTYTLGLCSDPFGYLYATGYTDGKLGGESLTGSTDLFVTKYNGSGDRQWVRLLGAAGSTANSYGITSDNLGNIFISGFTTGNLDGLSLVGTQDGFIVKYQ